MSDGRELADRFEVEFAERATFRMGNYVLRNDFSLAQGVLGRWRAEFARAEIRHNGAITKGPDARPIGNSEFCRYLHASALNRTGQICNQRVGHCSGSPY